jgi:hypothetical protein
LNDPLASNKKEPIGALWENYSLALALMNDREYLFARIACEIAPMLAGIKPASMISFGRFDRNLFELWEFYKYQAATKLGVRFFELHKSENHLSVLFFKHDDLKLTLSRSENRTFLRNCGYNCGYNGLISVERVLVSLRKKIPESFPHEIGLLLGIPIADIRGFIENGGEKFLFCGYWKVYRDPQLAEVVFQTYDKIRNAVMEIITLRLTHSSAYVIDQILEHAKNWKQPLNEAG